MEVETLPTYPGNSNETQHVQAPGETVEDSLTVPKKRKIPASRETSTPRALSPLPPSSSLNGPPEIKSEISLPLNTIARAPVFVPTSEPSFYITQDVPAGRNYRYIPARLSPTYNPAAGKDEHPYYRTAESLPTGIVRVSWEDRSPFVRVTEDGLCLMGHKGFRSARLNVPIREGQWYFEIEVLKGDGGTGSNDPSTSSYVRLGWGRRESSLNGPAGLDGYSYGFRDKTGEKVHLSRPRTYGRSFGTGDVVGLYLSLPQHRKSDSDDPLDPARIVPKRAPIQYKGQSYFESSEYLPCKEMMALLDTNNPLKTSVNGGLPPPPTKTSPLVKNTPSNGPMRKRLLPKPRPVPEPKVEPTRPLPILKGSAINLFVNGEDQGVAFSDLFSFLQLRQEKEPTKGGRTTAFKERENVFDDGTLGYYPFISLFGGAKVRINAGPNFSYPPSDDFLAGTATPLAEGQAKRWRPLCERYPEYLTELLVIDEEEEQQLRIARAAAAEVQKAEVAKRAKLEEKRKDMEKRERKVTPSRRGGSKEGTPAADGKKKRGSASPTPELVTRPSRPSAPSRLSSMTAQDSVPAPSLIEENAYALFSRSSIQRPALPPTDDDSTPPGWRRAGPTGSGQVPRPVSLPISSVFWQTPSHSTSSYTPPPPTTMQFPRYDRVIYDSPSFPSTGPPPVPRYPSYLGYTRVFEEPPSQPPSIVSSTATASSNASNLSLPNTLPPIPLHRPTPSPLFFSASAAASPSTPLQYKLPESNYSRSNTPGTPPVAVSRQMTAEEYTKLRETSASASESPAAPPSGTGANTPTSTIFPPPSEIHQNISHNVEEAIESKVPMGRTTATAIGSGVPRLPDAPPTHET